ncbi:MAG: hypothetical protein HUU54_12645 [Ignavibacteriaceae bacterium]|nr:hypothetical protein [Ignavibacteriaceae bacterium]
MLNVIGIRAETKDKTQRRAPLAPVHVRDLVRRHGIKVLVEPWPNRIFPDLDYKKAGAILTRDLTEANIIFGVKEIGVDYLLPGMTYCFFSHTVKEQPYNMGMLRKIVNDRSSLLDYELVKNPQGKRLIFFGEYAGLAGIIDTLWALGKRLRHEGIRNPFEKIRYATEYKELNEAKEDFYRVGLEILTKGLPPEIVPLVFGFTGYGNVTKGALRLFDILPTITISAEDYIELYNRGRLTNKAVYQILFKKSDLYKPKSSKIKFSTELLNNHPEKFVSGIEDLIPHLSVLVNGIYWDERYPRLVTRKYMFQLYKKSRKHKLKVIGDISCDINGSVELTVKETNMENPVFTFNPVNGEVSDGFTGKGPLIMAVDKLPTELPYEASLSFGDSLLPFVPELAAFDFSRPVKNSRLSEEMKKAIIVKRGKFVKEFEYLRKHM